MSKPRHNPDKPQNQYGGDFCCENYDTYADGIEFCHDEVGPRVYWAQVVDGKLVCRGNRHTCNKMRLRWLASQNASEEQ